MSQAQEFKAGARVVILHTDSVMNRCPGYAGALAVIEHAPQHPSTWFTVRVLNVDALIKLQPTAMKVVDDASEISTKASPLNAKSSPKNSGDIQSSSTLVDFQTPDTRIRSGSIDSSTAESRVRSGSFDLASSHVHTLSLGAEVVIRATENVMQVPQ
jgi:hypothetical protein